MKCKSGQKVEVIWTDAVAEADGWTELKTYDFRLTRLAGLMSTLGRMIKVQAGYLYIAQSYREPDGRFCSTIAIPMGCVKKIRKIK